MTLTNLLPPVITAAVVSSVGLPVLIRIGHRYQLLDMPGQHKRHRTPTPYLGGVALLASVWCALIVSMLFDHSLLGEFRGSTLYILAATLIIFMVGLSDDLSPVSAWVKLLAQAAAGIVLYLGGLSIDPLTIPFYGPVSLGAYSLVITVVWVILLTNAINLLDGLDGLAAGVSLIAGLTLGIVGWLYGVAPVVHLAGALVGFLAVFLYFNRYPARIFLGDSGSLQIGFYFAVISLIVPIRSFTAAALYLPLLVLAVPLLEAGLSLVRRLAARRPVMQADRRHLFHLLAMAGLSPRQIVLVFYLLSTIFGLFALAMYFLNRRWVLAFLLLFMVVIFLLFLILLSNLPRVRSRATRSDRPGKSDDSHGK